MNDNYYYILGLEKNATADEIKKAYRQLAKKYHPDKNPGKEEIFKRLSNAYKHLSDPNLKARFDTSLKPFSRTNYASGKTRYTPRTSYYTTERPKYSAKVKIYGNIFTLGFILFIVFLVSVLTYKASDYHYKEGLQYEKENNTPKAIKAYEEAINLIGQRSGEASIAAARLVLTKTVNPLAAYHFINMGIESTFNNNFLAELHYLKAKTLLLKRQYDDAVLELLESEKLGYIGDSVLLQLGLIYAFQLNDYEKGLENFDSILELNPNQLTALFGRGWCLQRLNAHREAIVTFDQFLTKDSENALGYYYRGLSEVENGDSIKACKDFKQSYNLGYTPAKNNKNGYCWTD